MISFKWRHFQKDLILMAVRWYVAYSLSYRNIEELMAERGMRRILKLKGSGIIYTVPLVNRVIR